MMNEQQSQNVFLKVDLLFTIRNNKLITQVKKLEKSKVESFCIEYTVAAYTRYTR